MGEKGIKYFSKGPKKKVKVGFFFFEVILSALDKSPDALSIKQLSRKCRIRYTTVRYTVNKLVEMNRLIFEERKIFKGPKVKCYSLSPWRLK